MIKLLSNIRKFIKIVFLNYFKIKKRNYLKYVMKMTKASKIEKSEITPYEYIDTIDMVSFPIKREVNIEKIPKCPEDKLTFLPVHTVCSLIEFYCKANKINVDKIESKNVYEYIKNKKEYETKSITIKDILKALKYFGLKETPKSFTISRNKTLFKIGNYFSVENMDMSNIPEELKRDKIILLKIKDCICKGTPVLVGLEITNLFGKMTTGKLNEQKYTGTNNINISMNTDICPFIITAYNDEEQYFKVYSGWGRRFGDDGYFKINYDTFLKDIKEIWYITHLNKYRKD